MNFFKIFLLYLMSLFLFCGLFFGGVYIGCRFMLGLVMEVLDYPTGLAALFPKIVALTAGLGGGFWGVLLAALTIRFLASHWLKDVRFGERPLLNITMSSFLGFILVLMILAALFGERTNIDKILKILLEG